MTRIAPARLLAILAGVAVAALLVLGLVELAGRSSSSSQGPGGEAEHLTLGQIEARLAGSPPALAALHAQSSQVLVGGGRALHARIAALHGYPLVINKWASWCVPCQSERGAFQQASLAFGHSVAFLGVDSGEPTIAGGQAFVRVRLLAYPSYYDKSGQLGTEVTDSSFTPVTVFYNRAGSEYIHQGPYPSAAKLERDIRRYALDA